MSLKRKRAAVSGPASDSGSDSDELAFDPDFVFDADGGLDSTKEPELGFSGLAQKQATGGVDLDAIIARKKAKLAEENGDSIGSDDESEEEFEDEEEFKGFGSDLGTWAGFFKTLTVLDNSEQAEDVEPEANMVPQENQPDEGDDADSVTSFRPHPDDGVSEDEKEESDPEEAARKAEYFAVPDDTPSSSVPTFLEMWISRPIVKALSAMKIYEPTQIQAKAIPYALEGKDIVGSAVTGSGKTGAFIIPILERLTFRSRSYARTRVLVLTPTRELAVQCFGVATKMSKFLDIKIALCVGGLSVKAQEEELRKRPEVVIATPGRFIDHVRNSHGFHPSHIEILVIDEADRFYLLKAI
jgi:ATP-dependent RNA helicase DDX27